MSWILGNVPAGGGESAPKRTKAKDGDYVTQRELTAQMEARLRSLEHGQSAQIHLPVNHVVVKNGQEKYQEHFRVVKEEGPEHGRGPPELQLFSQALKEIESWLEQEGSPAIQRFRGAPTVLIAMLAHGTSEDASECIKDCTYSPMYDHKIIGLTMALRDHIVVRSTVALAKTVDEAQKSTWGEAATDSTFEGVLQRIPLEPPSLGEGQKCMELMRSMSILLMVWGGGEMAKQLTGKKKD
ncbi:unnamed protein product [Prorocentrum cordatum]|uniref:Uncharacterized protein n=1 Tax=Prorocentrum cordatum TaxID=2364126 RepID=A0ABN9RGQ1_9DINO|nr:unnamed protein product [Polarella glacialis]